MTLREQCIEFQVKLDPIAKELGYSRNYVGMVLNGKRQNHKITSAVFLALEKRKSELRKLIK
jgi:hypothetical protein